MKGDTRSEGSCSWGWGSRHQTVPPRALEVIPRCWVGHGGQGGTHQNPPYSSLLQQLWLLPCSTLNLSFIWTLTAVVVMSLHVLVSFPVRNTLQQERQLTVGISSAPAYGQFGCRSYATHNAPCPQSELQREESCGIITMVKTLVHRFKNTGKMSL